MFPNRSKQPSKRFWRQEELIELNNLHLFNTDKGIIDIISAIAGGLVGFLFGKLDGMFYALVAFMTLDYISGVIVAFMEKKLSSEVGFRGICKKILIFIVVAVANIIDVQILDNSSVLRTGVIFIFLANEGLSILENSAAMGLPIPKALSKALTQLKQNSGNDSKDDENKTNEK